MGLKQVLFSTVAAFGMAALVSNAPVVAQPKPTAPAASVAIDADDIGGIVSGPNGPEAGVWGIAQTTHLPTRLTRSLVTHDPGRHLIPHLPTANYQILVRGYGFVGSPQLR